MLLTVNYMHFAGLQPVELRANGGGGQVVAAGSRSSQRWWW